MEVGIHLRGLPQPRGRGISQPLLVLRLTSRRPLPADVGRWTSGCACLHDRLTLTALDESEGILRADGLPRYRGVALVEHTL
jgi:hypothetical protein